MPLGYERLNERTQRPNACINFIKPLTSSSPQDQAIAKDFLERIAAQCYPVMKKDYVSVMALEEYPPNPEFLGRNFNAGEVIQLVLKDKAGRWLSFHFVQMVMMHELAHCKQMNHSKYFWQVRNRYADHMKELWSKKYEGEGMWGRGLDLTTGFVHERMPDNADIPEHLCGGTYRRARARKRKRGQDGTEQTKLSYAERQQKRIAKKFGVHGDGQGLGEDELVRGALEQGKRHYGKPRVANSKRGRELRANAALARFDALKQHTSRETPGLEDDDGSETGSSDDDEMADRINILETLGKIEDQNGRDLYKVCGDEGEQDEGGSNEMDELRLMTLNSGKLEPNDKQAAQINPSSSGKAAKRIHEDSETESETDDDTLPLPAPSEAHERPAPFKRKSTITEVPNTNTSDAKENEPESNSTSIPPNNVVDTNQVIASACPICSLEDEPESLTCIACSHVLKTSLMPNHWRCKGEKCKGSRYVNAGDVGRCGLCAAQRPISSSRPMGTTSADVLRWD